MQVHYIPKYLNAQIQLLWWELDEFMFLLVGIVIGIFTNVTPVGAAVGYVIMKIYIKLKGNKSDGYIKHYLYRWGLWGKRNLPPFWIKEMVE